MKRAAFLPFVAAVFLVLLIPTGNLLGKGPPAGGGAPSAPTGLAASLAFPHDVLLSWNANPEPDIAGYNVYRNTSPRGSFLKLTPAPVTATSYLDTAVSVGTTYFYKVSAVNSSGAEGKTSAAVSIAVAEVPDTFPPQNPSGFAARGGNAQVTLAWTNPSDGDFAGTIVRYALSGYPAGPGDGLPVCDRPAAPGSPDSFVHAGLENGRMHYYAAFSYDGAGNHSGGATASAAPFDNAAPAIFAVREENITSSGATIRWSTDEPADSQVEYGETLSYGSVTPLDPSLVTEHSALLQGLRPATLYHYRVVSADGSGNRSYSVDRSFSTAPQPGLACSDCHGPLPQYDHFALDGHGRSTIALSCETCHTSGHGHTGAFKELRAVNGFAYPGLPDNLNLSATVDGRKGYCLSACHAPSPPGAEHPNGYDYIARFGVWTFIEILSPEGYLQKYGVPGGPVLPASPEIRLLDVDRNGVNSFGDIVMCTTCHELHGTPTGYRMVPLVTGPETIDQLCVQCHASF